MKFEDQVVSFKLSTKLKELGIKQESLFFWVFDKTNDGWEVHFGDELEEEESYSAFTAAELGEILPNTITVPNQEPFDNFRIAISKFISVEDNKYINNYILNYECDSTAMTGEEAWLRKILTVNIYDPILANAMAKMLIYLVKNGINKH